MNWNWLINQIMGYITKNVKWTDFLLLVFMQIQNHYSSNSALSRRDKANMERNPQQDNYSFAVLDITPLKIEKPDGRWRPFGFIEDRLILNNPRRITSTDHKKVSDSNAQNDSITKSDKSFKLDIPLLVFGITMIAMSSLMRNQSQKVNVKTSQNQSTHISNNNKVETGDSTIVYVKGSNSCSSKQSTSTNMSRFSNATSEIIAKRFHQFSQDSYEYVLIKHCMKTNASYEASQSSFLFDAQLNYILNLKKTPKNNGQLNQKYIADIKKALNSITENMLKDRFEIYDQYNNFPVSDCDSNYMNSPGNVEKDEKRSNKKDRA